MLLLNKKHTDVLIEQTKTKPQETFEYKMIKQMQTFPFSPPANVVEEEKWLTVTCFEAIISVANITNENNNFANTISGHWHSQSNEKTIDKLKNS